MPTDPPDTSRQLGADAFRRVVRLARIELSEEEERELVPQLGEIAEWIEDLRRWKGGEKGDRLGAEGRATRTPTAEPDDAAADLRRRGARRAPVGQPGLDRDEALERAPESDAGFFVAPPIRSDE